MAGLFFNGYLALECPGRSRPSYDEGAHGRGLWSPCSLAGAALKTALGSHKTSDALERGCFHVRHDFPYEKISLPVRGIARHDPVGRYAHPFFIQPRIPLIVGVLASA